MLTFYCGIAGLFFWDAGADINIVSSTASPDGKFEAVVYTVNAGGATGRFSYNVSIVRQEQSPNRHDTVLSLHRMRSDKPIRVAWKSGRTLLIQYPPECELLSAKVRDIVGGTTFQIKFENLPHKP